MQKIASLLTLLAVLVGLIVTPNVSAAAPGDPNDSSQVDLRALERQILVEVNHIRTDPQATVTNLTTMVQNARFHSNGLTMPLPDGSETTISKQWYIDTAISTARNQKPLKELLWSDGLAQATGKYAARNPQGHRDFGTTLGSRVAEFGVSGGRVGEGINYGGATAMNQVYGLFIDDGNPDFGHRLALIDPTWTHMAAGCYYPNNYKDITCVLNYAVDWVDTINMVKLEVGKQYALREANNTFRYFKLTSTTNRGQFPIRIDLCPNPGSMGSINMPDAGGLMTIEQAQAKGLTAKNEPCSTDVAPHGILNNGTSLPIATSQDTGAVAPTQAPAAPSATAVAATQAPVAPSATSGQNSGPVNLEIGKQYALRGANNTFQYYKLTGSSASPSGGNNYFLGICPDPGSLPELLLLAKDTTKVMSIEAALAEGLTPKGQQCPTDVAPYGGQNNGASPPTPPSATPVPATQAPAAPSAIPGGNSGTLQLEVGKQYALREANNTFRYFKLTSTTNPGRFPIHIELCPEPGKMGSIDMSDAQNLITVEAALAENLIPKSEPCPTDVAPHGGQNSGASVPTAASQGGAQVAPTQVPAPAGNTAPLKLEIGKQYVVRMQDNTSLYGRFDRIYSLLNGAPSYQFSGCPNAGNGFRFQTMNLADIMTVEAALAANYTPTNEACSTTTVPYGN